jgi:hypothetical protein
MSTGEDFARELLEAQADRFASLLDGVPEATALAAAVSARQVATLVRATRASYVLLVEGEPPPAGDGLDAATAERLAASLASYRALHVVGAFGHTGQIEVVERSPKVADGIRQAAERHALAEHVRVHSGKPPTVVHALNGPYDLIVLGGRWREYERMEDDLTRLLRIGGSLTVLNAGSLADAPEDREATALRAFLSLLASDERYLLSTGLDFGGVLAARVR